MNRFKNSHAYWHLTGVLILLALVARPGVSPADLRPVNPHSDTSLPGRSFHFREPFHLPAGALQSKILFAHQWFQDSHLGAWEAGCRLVANYATHEDRDVDVYSRYRIVNVRRQQRPYWYEIELANANGSRADFNLACGLTENEDRDNGDDLALMVRLSDGVNWVNGSGPVTPVHPSAERWRCFAEGSIDEETRPITRQATCASRAEAETAALLRCRRDGDELGVSNCHLIPGQCWRMPTHGSAVPLDCGV